MIALCGSLAVWSKNQVPARPPSRTALDDLLWLWTEEMIQIPPHHHHHHHQKWCGFGETLPCILWNDWFLENTVQEEICDTHRGKGEDTSQMCVLLAFLLVGTSVWPTTNYCVFIAATTTTASHKSTASHKTTRTLHIQIISIQILQIKEVCSLQLDNYSDWFWTNFFPTPTGQSGLLLLLFVCLVLLFL